MPIVEVPSVPATFTLSAGSPLPNYDEQACTFAIPAGTWTAGTWHTEGSSDDLPSQRAIAAGDEVVMGVGGPLAYSLSQPVTAGQLAAINAAAGGTLNAILADLSPAFTDNVAEFVLILEGTPAPTCSYDVDPLFESYPAAGGSGIVSIVTTLSCPWAAVSNDAWITITGSALFVFGGVLRVQVYYDVAANPGPARVGTITAAGETVTISQEGVVVDIEVLNGTGGPGAYLRPFEESGTHIFYARLHYPNGYSPYDLNQLVTWADYHAVIVTAAGLQARIDAQGILRIYGATGAELALLSATPDVDLVRFGHP